MQYEVDEKFKTICSQIVSSKKSEKEWAENESDDMFQIGNYEGGFDATEMMFCFSLHVGGKEYWFQVSLDDVINIHNGKKSNVEIELAR